MVLISEFRWTAKYLYLIWTEKKDWCNKILGQLCIFIFIFYFKNWLLVVIVFSYILAITFFIIYWNYCLSSEHKFLCLTLVIRIYFHSYFLYIIKFIGRISSSYITLTVLKTYRNFHKLRLLFLAIMISCN